MPTSIEPPVYARIALDIAVKIAKGTIKENARLTGRSLTAGEYHVSPETIRRSFGLLADGEIIQVISQSGAVVLSREKAVQFIEKYNMGKDFRALKQELKSLLNERDSINTKILSLIDAIFDISERLRNSNPLYTLDFEIPENSPIVGMAINDVCFWHKTGATIVAVRRGGAMVLSPGPYFVFQPGDVIIVTGDTAITQRIQALIEP